jgi:hypothetical protein
MIRLMSTRVHGILDYLVGALLIAAPWLFGFADGTPAQWVPVILGAGLILYSLLTDYEDSLVRVIPMPVHLGLDVLGGLFLAVSPWLFGFSDRIWWPHLLIGLMEVGVAAITDPRPGEVRMRTRLPRTSGRPHTA